MPVKSINDLKKKIYPHLTKKNALIAGGVLLLFIVIAILPAKNETKITSKTTFESSVESVCDTKDFGDALCDKINGAKECQEDNNCVPYCKNLCEKEGLTLQTASYTRQFNEGEYNDFCKCTCQSCNT